MAPAPDGGPALKTWLMRAGQLALTVALTWLIVDRIGLGAEELRRLEPAAWTPDPLLLGAASLLLLAGYFASGAIWARMVRDLGGPRLSAREAVPLFMIANLGRYVPGKLWQIAALAALAKGRGVRATTASGAAVLGQGLALAAAAAIGLGALLGGPPRYRSLGIAGAIVVALVLALTAVPTLFHAGARAWFRLTRATPPAELEVAHGLRWLALYALNWALYAFAFWVLVRSMGLDGPLMPVASSYAAAYVLGYAAFFAPAGLGPREGFLIAFLTPHFGAAPSTVVAVVARLWTTVVEVVPAAYFWTRRMSASASGARSHSPVASDAQPGQRDAGRATREAGPAPRESTEGQGSPEAPSAGVDGKPSVGVGGNGPGDARG